jgi:hypothetical protein
MKDFEPVSTAEASFESGRVARRAFLAAAFGTAGGFFLLTKAAGASGFRTIAPSVNAATEAAPAGSPPRPTFAIVGAETPAAMAACVQGGAGEVVIQAAWSALQPGGAGTALSPSAVASLQQLFIVASAAGAAVVFEFAIHYAPAWVIAEVEPFTDQTGRTWTGVQADGDGVANWFWTAAGRALVATFLQDVTTAIGPAAMAQVTEIRVGGGPYGELHYPASPSNTGAGAAPAVSFYGFGPSQQHGKGLAAGLSVCPLPGYVPFAGGGGRAQSAAYDAQWIGWYMTGLTTWLAFLSTSLTGLGWKAQRLMVLHPGYGVRSNHTASSPGYQASVAAGEDPVTVMASYQSIANMWPWCTWIDGTDGWTPPSVDSDFAAWKKIYATALRYGKATYVRGENTSATSPPSVMDYIFDNALATVPASGYPLGVTATTWYGYRGLMWLNYAGLTSGQAAVVQLPYYQTSIQRL